MLVCAAPALAGPPEAKEKMAAFSDAQVCRAVEREIRSDRALPFDDIDVAVHDGIATLRGTVGSLLAKERAMRQAQTVKGVRSVVNRLDVPPTLGLTDADLAKHVESALLADPAADAYEIMPSAKNGIIRLEGSVDSWRERMLAETVSKGVRGVRGVVNDITVVSSAAERPDAEIDAEIEQALHWDVYIDDARIDVEVTDGTVKLSGIVGSAAERRLAMAKAWTRGVLRLDSDDLEVRLWARDPSLRKDKFRKVDDEKIEAALQAVLAQDPRVIPVGVEADVHNGLVTLTGVVDNLRAKRAAAQDARNTVGVTSVLDHLKVRPKRVLDNQALADHVRAALKRDPFTSLLDIEVTARDGAVRLSGEVDSLFERSQADEVAARVRGVRKIRNRLSVVDTPLDYDPYVDVWYVYDHGILAVPVWRTDMGDLALEARIHQELAWSPFVDATAIDVDVHDGVAELTGVVGSWMESNFARQNAYEGGALLVKNELTIRDDDNESAQ